MAANIGDFFIYSNSVQGVTEEDYRKIELLVNTVESFARSTYLYHRLFQEGLFICF